MDLALVEQGFILLDPTDPGQVQITLLDHQDSAGIPFLHACPIPYGSDGVIQVPGIHGLLHRVFLSQRVKVPTESKVAPR